MNPSDELIDLLVDVKKIISSVNTDHPILSRINVCQRNLINTSQRVSWSRNSEDVRREKAKYRNFTMYVWPEDKSSHPYFRYLVTKRGELVKMDDCNSREEAKMLAEKCVFSESRNDIY